jgi:hypothetical protein
MFGSLPTSTKKKKKKLETTNLELAFEGGLMFLS